MTQFVFFCCEILIMASIFGLSTSMHSSKALEGYPAGYLGYCPNKTLKIGADDLRFLLFTVRGSGSPKKIKYNYYQMHLLNKDPAIDWSKRTFIYVGGYLQTTRNLDNLATDQVFRKLGYNVWLLDQTHFVLGPYPPVAMLTQKVGAHIAEMMAKVTNLDPSKVEMAGLSLGAHTMSFVAKNYYWQTGKKIDKLTGLDPAGPCFRNAGPERRLDDSDANYVEVVQTNIDGAGMAAPVGHVNFYVNGGEYQIAGLDYIPCNVACSHVKSLFYWIASINYPRGFIGIKCDSVQQARDRECYDNKPQVTNLLGIKSDREKPGIYYLSTANSYPYFLGKNGLKKEYDNVGVILKRVFSGDFSR